MNVEQLSASNEFDHDYWSELDNTTKKYYESFYMGDAYIKSSDNTIGVDLSIVDYDWLVRYKTNLFIDNKIYLRDHRANKNSITASVRKKDKQWVKDLAKYGMVPRKTNKEYLPVEYIDSAKDAGAMLLGIFDSDGSIYKEKSTGKYRISFTGNHTICTQINDIIQEYTDIEPNAVTLSNKSCDFIFSTRHGAKDDLVKLYNFMYDANPELESCWLNRKHNIFTSFMLQYYKDKVVT